MRRSPSGLKSEMGFSYPTTWWCIAFVLSLCCCAVSESTDASARSRARPTLAASPHDARTIVEQQHHDKAAQLVPVKTGESSSATSPTPDAPTAQPERATTSESSAVEDGVSGLLQSISPMIITTPEKLATAWLSHKQEDNIRRQHKGLMRADLGRRITTDLVNFRAGEGSGLPSFGWRDRYRQRVWCSPLMAATLVLAHERLQSTHPGIKVSIGDLSQPGGGTLFHNALVEHREGDEADALLSEIQLFYGVAARIRYPTVAVYPTEAHRFDARTESLMVIERLIAKRGDDASPQLRVETTRYAPSHISETSSVEPLDGVWETFRRGSRLVSRERVAHTASDGSTNAVWLHHWVNARARRQLRVASKRLLRRPPRDRDTIEMLAVSQWQRKKPLSFPREALWLRDGERWSAWRAVVEAGHISHMAGRDVDLAYINQGNVDHFRVAPESLAPRQMRAWLMAVKEAAESLGGRLEVVLMSRSMIRRLKEGYSSSAWKRHDLAHVVKAASGHGGHHHLRISAETRESRIKALSALTARGIRLPALSLMPEPR